MITQITKDKASALAAIAEMFDASEVDVAASPAVLVGSVAEITETLQERRDRWGFNYVVVQQDGGQGIERFAEVVAALTGT